MQCCRKVRMNATIINCELNPYKQRKYVVLIYKCCYVRLGSALSGEPTNGQRKLKNKRGKRKIVHCLKLLTKGRGKFGQFSLTNAGFLSEAGIALTFLLPFCGKWNIPTAASGIKRKSGSQGWKPLFKILNA